MIRWTERHMWPQKKRLRERSSICFGWPGLKTFLSQWIQKYYEILLGFVPSWSLNQCPGSTKLLAKVSSRTITFSLLLEPSAASSTALEGSSMESSWTGFILTHAWFALADCCLLVDLFNLLSFRTSYRTAMGVEMVLLTILVSTLSTTSVLGKV